VSLQQLIDQAMAAVSHAISSPTEIAALLAAAAAAGLTVTSSFVKTMVPLRGLALCSNIGFLAYGVLHPSIVMALLHGTLLPINCVRFAEMLRLTRRVRAAAASADSSGVWLKPYMKATRRKAGEVLFNKGDPADHLYFLADGRIEFVEIAQTMGPGRVFGELAFFLPSGRRTLTARCVDDCLVLSVNQHTVRELYYQNPSFGFELIGLVAGRLSADIDRLHADIERLQGQLGRREAAA
jgi:CRP-like cAMP-binding protein